MFNMPQLCMFSAIYLSAVCMIYWFYPRVVFFSWYWRCQRRRRQADHLSYLKLSMERLMIHNGSNGSRRSQRLGCGYKGSQWKSQHQRNELDTKLVQRNERRQMLSFQEKYFKIYAWWWAGLFFFLFRCSKTLRQYTMRCTQVYW